mgnify:CR=1 FL=1
MAYAVQDAVYFVLCHRSTHLPPLPLPDFQRALISFRSFPHPPPTPIHLLGTGGRGATGLFAPRGRVTKHEPQHEREKDGLDPRDQAKARNAFVKRLDLNGGHVLNDLLGK